MFVNKGALFMTQRLIILFLLLVAWPLISQDKGFQRVSTLTATDEGLNKWALVIGILAPSTWNQPELILDDWAGNSDRLKLRDKLSTNF